MYLLKKLFNGDKRTVLYRKNTIIVLVCQAINIIVNFLLVSVVLNYLGVEEYGIWIILTTIVSWFTFFDIGLGHGLRNRYAEEKVKGNEENIKMYVSSTFYMLLLISGIIFILSLIIILNINCSSAIGAPSDLESKLKVILLFMVGCFCIRFVANIALILQISEQRPGTSYIAIAIGNLLSLISVFIITKITLPSILYIGIGLSISPIIPVLIIFIYLFSTSYKKIRPSIKHVSFKSAYDIINLGLKFFVIQLTGLVLYQSNNIIISHICGLNEVTEYNISYKLLWVLVIIYNAILTPFWSASTEAYIKKDIVWIRNTIRMLNKILIALIVVGVIIVISSPIIYKIWLNGKIQPNYLLLICTLLYFSFYMRHSTYRMFINGVGKIRLQFYVTLIQSIIHIPLAIFLGKLMGVIGVVIVMAIWTIINSIWEPIQFKKIITENNIQTNNIWYK